MNTSTIRKALGTSIIGVLGAGALAECSADAAPQVGDTVQLSAMNETTSEAQIVGFDDDRVRLYAEIQPEELRTGAEITEDDETGEICMDRWAVAWLPHDAQVVSAEMEPGFQDDEWNLSDWPEDSTRLGVSSSTDCFLDYEGLKDMSTGTSGLSLHVFFDAPAEEVLN